MAETSERDGGGRRGSGAGRADGGATSGSGVRSGGTLQGNSGNAGEAQGNGSAPRKGGMTRRSILLGIGILAVSLVAQACITFFGSLRKGRSASITDGDGVVHEIPLDTDGLTEITTALGTNTVEVADGQIRVVDATCGNKDCVHQGAINRPGQTIVCLPNRLVIRIEGADDEDNDPDTDGRTPPQPDTISG
jgi:hypothetical protein